MCQLNLKQVIFKTSNLFEIFGKLLFLTSELRFKDGPFRLLFIFHNNNLRYNLLLSYMPEVEPSIKDFYI